MLLDIAVGVAVCPRLLLRVFSCYVLFCLLLFLLPFSCSLALLGVAVDIVSTVVADVVPVMVSVRVAALLLSH